MRHQAVEHPRRRLPPVELLVNGACELDPLLPRNREFVQDGVHFLPGGIELALPVIDLLLGLHDGRGALLRLLPPPRELLAELPRSLRELLPHPVELSLEHLNALLQLVLNVVPVVCLGCPSAVLCTVQCLCRLIRTMTKAFSLGFVCL